MAQTIVNIHLKTEDAPTIKARRIPSHAQDFVVLHVADHVLFVGSREIAQALRAAADLADDLLALVEAEALAAAETEAERARYDEPSWQNEKDHMDADAAAGKAV